MKGKLKRGQAFVVFQNANCAAIAMNEQHGKVLFDRTMHIELARNTSKCLLAESRAKEELETLREESATLSTPIENQNNK